MKQRLGNVKQKGMSSPLLRLVSVVLVIAMLTMGMASSVVAADDSPTITTDKTKYSVGEAMVISGTGFTPEGTVNIEVQLPGNNGINALDPVTTDAAGAFQTSYAPPLIPGRYRITATDGINTAKAAATEADAENEKLWNWMPAEANVTSSNGAWGNGNPNVPDRWYKEGSWEGFCLVLKGYNAVPTLNLAWDFYDSGKDAVLCDLLRNFRYDIVDASLIPSNGDPYNVVNPGTAGSWGHTFTPTILNQPYEGPETPASPAAVHYFQLSPADTTSEAVNPSTQAIVVYWEAHLALTFVWQYGLESLYATNPPANSEGGATYSGWTATHMGSGSYPGASGQFYLKQKGGDKTAQIPVPEAPTGSISGQKYNDENGNGKWDGGEPFLSGWNITIAASLEGIPFTASNLTDAGGTYSFTSLIQGTYYISEILQAGWTQTQPAADHTPP